MRIKEQYSRNELEGFSVHRIKRIFRVPRNARYTKMRLIEKVMKKMDEKYDRASEIDVPEINILEPSIIEEPIIEPEIEPEIIEMIAAEPLPTREELETTNWRKLQGRYSIKVEKGVSKQVAINRILAGQYTLDKKYIENEM